MTQFNVLLVLVLIQFCLSQAPRSGTILECTGSGVNARAGPCTNQRVIGTLNQGNTVTSLGQEQSGCGHKWWKVKASFGDAWVASTYLRVRQNPGTGLCFPLKQNSFSHVVVNWGGSRSNGARCHAGIDVFSKAPGHVVAVEDGTVTNIFNFLACKDGKEINSHNNRMVRISFLIIQRGCRNGGCPGQTVAVMVYHPKLGKTINYGEVDGNKVNVKRGQAIKKGQMIGIASYCGMLHFEIYEGSRTANSHWYPPSGGRAGNPDKCAREYMRTKPRELEDPRPWIQQRLSGKFC